MCAVDRLGGPQSGRGAVQAGGIRSHAASGPAERGLGVVGQKASQGGGAADHIDKARPNVRQDWAGTVHAPRPLPG
jgi:hypothetical protein